GGLDGADLKCREAAKNAGITNYSSFRAWLSDDTGSPLTRFVHGPELAGVPYVLRDGKRVADDWDDLVLHGPQRPIDVTELGPCCCRKARYGPTLRIQVRRGACRTIVRTGPSPTPYCLPYA